MAIPSFFIHNMNYASLNELILDTKQLLRSINRNEVSLVVGIPRSGMIPATIIACELQKPMIVASETTVIPPDTKGIVLVVDDSVANGSKMGSILNGLKAPADAKIVRAAIYSTRTNSRHVDMYARVIRLPRFFEWNMWTHPKITLTALDMDGVLCEDPTVPDDDGEAYVEAITNAKPLHLPKYKVALIATGRLERWRSITEKWLRQNNVSFEKLVMSSHNTSNERRKAKDVPYMKAQAYASSKALLFVESEDRQAQRIHNACGLPVLSLGKGVVYRK